jgi:uncharacterized protein YegP (UPF0339 family)
MAVMKSRLELLMPQKRSFPSFFMFRDKEGNWRWNFSGPGGRVIATSSLAYARGGGCLRAIQLLKGANDYPVYGPPDDIKLVHERVAAAKAAGQKPAAAPQPVAKKSGPSNKAPASGKTAKAK